MSNKKQKELYEAPTDLLHVTETSTLPRWRTQFNSHLYRRDDEVITLPSLTMPDHSLTVRELIDRHTRGIPFPVGKVPLYENEDAMIPTDWYQWDLSQKEEFKKKKAEEALAIRIRWEQEESDKKEKAKKESYRKEFEQLQKEKEAAEQALKNNPEKK